MMDLIAILTSPLADGFFQATMRLAVPILLAALGGVLAERAGVMNIGLEGMMLVGAFVGFVSAFYTGNLWFGALMGVVAGAMMGLLLSLYTVVLTSNQVVVGIALNLLALGATSFAFRALFGMGMTQPRVTPFQPILIPVLSDIPVLGPLLFSQTILVYVALLLVFAIWVFAIKSSYGLAVTAVGEHPEAAETLGISVAKTRTLSLVASGSLAGLGGAFLSLSATGLFLDNMTAGRGYIALAILALGRRHPVGVLLASIVFGSADALQLRGQNMGIDLSYQFLLMLPYLLTILVLVTFARNAHDPAALGQPFKRARAK